MNTVAPAASEALPSAPEQSALATGRRVLQAEAGAVTALADRLDASFCDAVAAVLASPGKVVVSGMGKSGLVARKFVATLTSTGTPAVFLHGADSLHGDLGILAAGDVLIVVSRSGTTRDLDGVLGFASSHAIDVIALVGDMESPLAKRARVALDCGVSEEACPLNLAPTSSTTATMAMGDALAAALLEQRGFQSDDFARLHPAGALGRRLTMRVRDVMDSEQYPTISDEAAVREVIVPLARRRGTVPVVGHDGCVVGVVTAGDLTRLMQDRNDFLDVPMTEVMNRWPKTAKPDEMAVVAARRMERHGIMALPVISDGQLIGMVHLHDLLRAGAR